MNCKGGCSDEATKEAATIRLQRCIVEEAVVMGEEAVVIRWKNLQLL